MEQKKNAYSKFRLNLYIKATDPNVQLLIGVETYRAMLYFTNMEKADMHFINGTTNGNNSCLYSLSTSIQKTWFERLNFIHHKSDFIREYHLSV